MIGQGGKYYQIEVAISHGRQLGAPWWQPVDYATDLNEAQTIARGRAKRNKRVRIIRVDCEVVWASPAALVATGQPVE